MFPGSDESLVLWALVRKGVICHDSPSAARSPPPRPAPKPPFHMHRSQTLSLLAFSVPPSLHPRPLTSPTAAWRCSHQAADRNSRPAQTGLRAGERGGHLTSWARQHSGLGLARCRFGAAPVSRPADDGDCSGSFFAARRARSPSAGPAGMEPLVLGRGGGEGGAAQAGQPGCRSISGELRAQVERWLGKCFAEVGAWFGGVSM